MKKHILTIAIILVSIVLASAQEIKEASLVVNGVTFGSKYSAVIKTFGKPVKETKPIENECGGGFLKDLSFTGISFSFFADTKKGVYKVIDMTVKSKRYKTDKGIGIGSTIKAVKARYGNTDASEIDGRKALSYNLRNSVGGVTFLFDGGRVVEIQMQSTLC